MGSRESRRELEWDWRFRAVFATVERSGLVPLHRSIEIDDLGAGSQAVLIAGVVVHDLYGVSRCIPLNVDRLGAFLRSTVMATPRELCEEVAGRYQSGHSRGRDDRNG